MTDHDFMRRALALAREGWGQTAPNPMVGAVVVRDGVVVGEGYHRRYGEAHAERNALVAAGERARGATLYVTLEPCAHTGKTPPCVDAIVEAGISRVVIAARDPNPVAAGGAERLRATGIEVHTGIEEREARELNAAFHFFHRSDRPWVTLKLALSLDGAIADASRKQRWLTGPESRREVHRMRANASAVAVGSGTVLADDPSLTVREGPLPRMQPVRVVFDRQLRLSPTSTLARTARELPVVVFTSDASAPAAARLGEIGVQVVAVNDLVHALRWLHSRNFQHLLVEGGAELAAGFLEAGLVDRLTIFRAPIVLGSGALGAFSCLGPAGRARLDRLSVVEQRTFGGDVMTVYECTPS